MTEAFSPSFIYSKQTSTGKVGLWRWGYCHDDHAPVWCECACVWEEESVHMRVALSSHAKPVPVYIKVLDTAAVLLLCTAVSSHPIEGCFPPPQAGYPPTQRFPQETHKSKCIIRLKVVNLGLRSEVESNAYIHIGLMNGTTTPAAQARTRGPLYERGIYGCTVHNDTINKQRQTDPKKMKSNDDGWCDTKKNENQAWCVQ